MRGVIIKSTGSWYSVMNENGHYLDCRIKGKLRLKDFKSTNPVAVGDRVEFEMEEGKETGVIKNVFERKNYIIRKATNLSKQTHIIAANIDQAFLIVTLALPRTSTGFIDRFLVTAEAYHIPTILIFNKSDLFEKDNKTDPEETISIYEKTGYECLSVSAFKKVDIERLKDKMSGKTTLFAGHSGVGKSTLINELTGMKLKTGDISSTHAKGMHTTTFAEMFPVGNSFIIDTPGIKEFGMVDMQKDELSGYFPEMLKRKNDCRFNNCLHLNEPGCAIKKAVEDGEISESRYLNYLSILHSEELKDEFQ